MIQIKSFANQWLELKLIWDVVFQRLITRSLSEGETLTSGATSPPLNRTPNRREEKDTQHKRRSTLGAFAVGLSVPAVPLSAMRITFIAKKNSSFSCFPCSVIYASIRGPEWKHLCEGNLNHQSGAFRVASSQPRAAAITEYALFKFPWLCQSNDSANKLRILVFVSRIYQVRLLIFFAIHVFAETQNGESFFFFFQRNFLLLCCYCVQAFSNIYFLRCPNYIQRTF